MSRVPLTRIAGVWLTFALSGALAGCNVPPPAPGPQPDQEQVAFHTLLDSYAADLTGAVGDKNLKLAVQPTAASRPLGKILVGNVEFDGCDPPAEDIPASDEAVNWSPAEGTDEQFSASLGLPAALTGGIVALSGAADRNRTVALDFKNLSLHEIDLSPFQTLLKTPACAAKVDSALGEGDTVTIVMGWISGAEDFKFSDTKGFSIDVSAAKLGGFSVGGTAGAPDELIEATPQVHFLELYTVSAPIPAQLAAALPVSTAPAPAVVQSIASGITAPVAPAKGD